MKAGGYIYITSNYRRTTFYIGVTDDLRRRMEEHKSGKGSEFTTKYKCEYLVYFECFEKIIDAIAREKQLKNWHREWKLNLIRNVNPDLRDLTDELLLL